MNSLKYNDGIEIQEGDLIKINSLHSLANWRNQIGIVLSLRTVENYVQIFFPIVPSSAFWKSKVMMWQSKSLIKLN